MSQSQKTNQANKQISGGEDHVFCIECCQEMSEYGWHTRHDEKKYIEFFDKVSAAIIERIPNAIVMRNQIPKEYVDFDLYCNLVPNSEDSCPTFQQIPRHWAFEVSYKGFLIFSKIQQKYWPNVELVANKCAALVQEHAKGRDVSEFLAGMSPVKGGGAIPSVRKGQRTGGSPHRTAKKETPNKAGYSISAQQPMPFNQQKADDVPLRDQQALIQADQPAEEQQKELQKEESKKFIEPAQASPATAKEENLAPTLCGQHLKDENELTGFPTFSPGEDKSLLCKHLTEKVWNEYKNQDDDMGVSFKTMIFSGCKNTDSGVGVYAGSAASYKKFEGLFGPVIKDYHKFDYTKEVHTSNMDYTKLQCPPFSEEDAKMIKSTRIRVGRNLAAYPLGPGITKAQRLEVEQKVSQALSGMDGDLKGTYYPLSGMSEDVQKQLIADHFLFKEGDRFLEACKLNRNWPEGRGIFHNDAKTFLVWINEEDQLRIISMQPGADIGAVFSRLSRAASEIEKVAEFAHSKELGYITSCPTNLGTALRASVHIHLPLLGSKKAEFQAIADKYNVQIRGAHGEHTETNDHIYDISNKRRLGLSEVALVQDMYDGVKAMIEAEKALQPKGDAPAQAAPTGSGPVCGRDLKEEELTSLPQFKAGEQGSLLCKYLTQDVWDSYHDKSDPHGVSFKTCILSGCQNPDSGIGAYAGSMEGYDTFEKLFTPIIIDYHKVDINKEKHVSDMDHTKLQCPPFSEEDAKMIKSTRIRVGRNLAEFPLGPGITKEQRLEVEQKVSTALSGMDGDLKGTYYPLSGMSADVQKQLIDDHFLFKEGDRFLQSCGLNRNWPEGRGIYHNDAKTFLVWINEEDQLRIISMQPGADIGAVFSRLSRAATEIEKVAKFAHSEKLGYITSCPTNLGTALRASVHIHLPLLGNDKAAFKAIADKYNVQIRGAHGEHTETNDHIYDISNKRRLGLSEVALVQDMYDGVKAMIEAEKELQSKGGAPAQAAAPAGSGPVCSRDLKEEELTALPTFKAGEQGSLLCKYLTQDVWDSYHDKSDPHGVSFKTCILSGCQNPDSGIGAYAGSKESYDTFTKLFTPIIVDYHKVDVTKQKHVSDMDHTKLNCPPFSEEDAKMIKSTRIRVGRNLDGYPLGPGITKEQRDEVEQKVSTALSSMEGDLKGTYYPLSGMAPETQKQLIEDHFLFKEGDRFLQSCGLNRNWPDGRGIYHNDAKTFLVWINEEDQLRIISMQPGADIGAVFSRLSRAATEIEKVAKFSHSEELGYITSCPTNLGTALRASVHIHLPFLGQEKDLFKRIADKYNVQIRGAHGEHTETNDHIYDISNKRRLGLSEVQLVQDMYDGVKAMIEAEKEMMPKKKEEKTIKAGAHLLEPEMLTGFPEFPADCKSLLSKCLTKEIWDEYKDKSDKFGVTFKQCILSGCQNVDSGIGVYAGSHEGYTDFAKLMDKIIEEYHGHAKDAKHESNMDYSKLDAPPLPEDQAKMIKSTRIRVGRNLAKYPLGPGITKEQRDEVEQAAIKAFESFEGELKGTYYPLAGMAPETQKQLIEDHFLFKEGDRFLDACGLNRDWPAGRGIFHNDAKTFLVWVNEEDQFRIISMQPGADIGAVFKRLSDAAAAIEKVASFSHDDHLGYITSCPTNCGTALRASVHIHLPLLGKDKAAFQAIADKYYVQIRGAHGEHTETDDHIYDISNKRRLGRSEVDLVQDMYNGVKAMIEAEMALAPKE